MSDFHNENVMYVRSVTLRVKDIATMLDFYTRILKMTLIDRQDNLYRLGTDDNRVLIDLVFDPEAKKERRRTGLYHFALLWPSHHDLGIFFKYCLTNHIDLSGASNHDVSDALYLSDPEGNGIEIYADRPSKDWKFTKDGILMTTATIDHEALLEEKGEYERIPINTFIGHIHLSVNSIAEASHFYVDVIGFNKMLDYGPTASFISDGGYHHHIAFNTWSGTNNQNLGKHETGLIEYEINLPINRVNQLIQSLVKAGIDHDRLGNLIIVHDINGTNIAFIY